MAWVNIATPLTFFVGRLYPRNSDALPTVSWNSTQLAVLYAILLPRILSTSWKILGASLVTQVVKNLPAMQETWVPSLGREDPLEHGNPFQYSCLKNLMDRGAWQAAPHRVTQSPT